MDYVLVLAGVLALLILLRILTVQKKPLRTVLYGGMKGVAALGAVNLAGLLTGVTIPVSVLSLGLTFLCGVPGVITILVLNLVFSS